MRSGILDTLDAASKAALNLSNNPLIIADGQRAVFDATGYHGFRIDPITGVYSPKQMELTNNVLRFTTDNWATTKGAFGEFQLANGTTVYGLNADTVVAGKIQSATNPYVYFDLNNGILAASRLSSSVAGHTDVYASVGIVNWSSGDITSGFVLNDDLGTFALLARNPVTANTVSLMTPNQNLKIIANSGSTDQCDITLGSDMMKFSANTKISFMTDDIERGSIDVDGYHGWIDSNSINALTRISFKTGGVERGSLDSSGWHGNFPDIHLPSGITGEVGVTRSDGSKRIMHFTNGIFDDIYS